MAVITSPFGGVNQDLTLVIDRSGSMGEEIGTVVDSAVEIVNALLAGTNSRVSVLTYEFDQDLVQDFTDDQTTAVTSIETLGSVSGGTENIMDALIATFNGDLGEWDSSAERHRVILFGDEPGDDLARFDEMVQLSEQAIATSGTVDVDVYPVLLSGDSGSFEPGTRESFQDIASATGGALIEAERLDEIVDSILSIILTGTENTVGTAQSDEVIGSIGFDTIFAGAGNDTISGNGGSDQIFGGDGDDLAYGGVGNDTMYGGNGNDLIVSGRGTDEIFGGGGSDQIGGGEGNDMLGGGGGSDAAFGAAGADTVFGGSGAFGDVAYGGDEEDLIYGGGGADTLAGGSGEDEIGGGGGRDAIAAGDDDDLCYGGAGNDTIYTGDGRDTVYGGTGSDQLYLGGRDYSSDLVVADALNGNDTVYGFEEFYDEVDLSATNLSSFADVEAALSTNAAGNAVLTFQGGTITFFGLDESDLSSFNFTF